MSARREKKRKKEKKKNPITARLPHRARDSRETLLSLIEPRVHPSHVTHWPLAAVDGGGAGCGRYTRYQSYFPSFLYDFRYRFVMDCGKGARLTGLEPATEIARFVSSCSLHANLPFFSVFPFLRYYRGAKCLSSLVRLSIRTLAVLRTKGGKLW